MKEIKEEEKINRTSQVKVYYAIVALFVIILSFSTLLVKGMEEGYKESIKKAEEWSEYGNRIANISSLVTKANLPGNDIFSSKDVEKESFLYESYMSDLSREIEAAERTIDYDEDIEESNKILLSLRNVGKSMGEHKKETNFILLEFSKGNIEKASGHMSAMDRHHSKMVEELRGIGNRITNINRNIFERQNKEATELNRRGYILDIIILITVIFTTVYSGYLMKTIKESDAKRRELEKESERARDRVTGILEDLVDAVITIDEKGQIISCNPACEVLFGYQVEEMVGRNVKMLMPQPYKKEHDGYLENYHKTGVKKIIGIGREVEATRKDGTVFPVELAISETTYEGEKIFTGTIRDISARKEFETQISDSKQRLQAVLDTVVDGIITISKEGIIESFNPAAEEIFGYGADEVIGKNVKTLMPEPYRKEHDGYVNNYLETGSAKVIGIGREVEAKRKDGSVFPMELGVSEISVSGDRMFVGIIRDISERKESEEKLQKYAQDLEWQKIELEESKEVAENANNMKSEFLASMSHEIRTPMNGVIGMTELMLEDELTEKQRSRAEAVISSADSLMTIINDILDFSKIESGKMDLEPIDFNLRRNIEEVLELFAPKAGGKDIELILRYSPDIPDFVVGDQVRVRQIISNLISNSIKFTNEGHILVSVEKLGGNKKKGSIGIKVTIQDTGIGIPKEKLSDIFEKFSQADASTTRKFGGTGLGLAICKQLTEIMNGEIDVESVEGEGAKFWFTMELGKSQITGEELDIDEEVLKGSRVLIVDDNKINVEILEKVLAEYGIETASAESGKEGLNILEKAQKSKEEFDVVLVDYRMPEMDGISFSEEINKNKKAYGNAPMVMLSSSIDRRITEHVTGAGFCACLMKPVKDNHLIRLISMIREAKNAGRDVGHISEGSLYSKSKSKKMDYSNAHFKDTKVLLVEDNLTNQALAEEMLLDFGCDVLIANNGLEAIEKTKENNDFDIILMDCQMPEMDGFEASEKICEMKKNGEVKEVPIIALTANAMKGDKEKCMAAGMDDYLTKPVRKNNLQEMLAKWISEEKISESGDVVSIKSNNHKKEKKMENESELNMEELEEAKRVLKQRFPEMVEGYLEDARKYIANIKEGSEEGDLEKIAKGAHPLKSSSAGLGVTKVSEIAKFIEAEAKEGGSIESIKEQILPIEEALSSAENTLRNMIKDAA